MQKHSDTERFYALLNELEYRLGGARRLADCSSKMRWPKRGVYFFFEPDEFRSGCLQKRRVVRVGTHALKANSGTTLWGRLRQHRGTLNPKGGNHRGSIFRLLVGEALAKANPEHAIGTWGVGSCAVGEVRAAERAHEARVSDYLGGMTVLYVDVPDEAGAQSARGVIERNSIALLSTYHQTGPDRPKESWLGHQSGRPKVCRSGLWNNNHVNEGYDPDFLAIFSGLIQRMPVER